MSLFSRLFSKTPPDLLAKGDRHMESDSFFDARSCYEDGLSRCSGGGQGYGEMVSVFTERIETANRKLAECNLKEAEHAYARGDLVKAADHLELVKTLTYDQVLREKAEELLHLFSTQDDSPEEPITISSCSSCSSCSDSSAGGRDGSTPIDNSLPLSEYYELLIQQLPHEEYLRYAGLGEDFAYAYIAASRDEHLQALSGLDKCADSLPPDIFCYEKGKVLHRLGNEREAEQYLRRAVQHNADNSLAWLNLALVLGAENRFQEALAVIETMVAGNIMTEQVLLLRGDIFVATGNREDAVNQYIELLHTSNARPAAERLYGLLQELGRQSDAAVILKKYLHKSCH